MLKKILLILILCFSVNYDGNTSDYSSFIKKLKDVTYRNYSKYEFNNKSSLKDRIKKCPDFVIEYLKAYDNMKSYENYEPTKSEKVLVNSYIELLPDLYKKLIKNRLIAIYFVKDFLGSGLADYIIDFDDNNKLYFVIVLNPETLKHNISDWVTYKENTCFINNDTSINIKIDCGTNYKGLMYILLHEITHIVDYVDMITPYVENDIKIIKGIDSPEMTDFVTGIWGNRNNPIKKYEYLMREKVTFYGFSMGPKIKISTAKLIYPDFANTPFVSIYGSKNWAEDLAEYCTFYYLTQIMNQPYEIQLYKNNKKVFTYKPFDSVLVKQRMEIVLKMLKN